MPEVAAPRSQSLQSLERGMAVIQIFSRERPALTLSEVARLTGMTRASARRVLLTLEKLGHVRCEGRRFSLTPRVLTLGWAYLSSLSMWEVTYPLMEELAAQTGESCSVATLDLPDVVYVARVPTRRIMNISLGVGSRLPAHATSMGRVLLAGLPVDELEQFLADNPLEPFTEYTITDPDELAAEVTKVRGQGWAFVDQELELGLRSIAVPIRGAGCRTAAALNTSASAPRVSIHEFFDRFLPALLSTAELVSATFRPSLVGGPVQGSSDGGAVGRRPTADAALRA
jgi:IclR family transcriptional regulator, pca regulon regulatory protein